MAIDFQKTFGNRSTERTNTNNSDKPKTQVWLNFGYVAAEGTEQERFVSLPVGIPLDTTEAIQIRGQNTEHNMFTAARNDLLKQFQELGESLEPGDFHLIRMEGDLAVQIRRIDAEHAAPAADESNVFARPNLFAVAA